MIPYTPFVIWSVVLLAGTATAKATPVPLSVPTLPPISAARDLPYPATGSARPDIVSTRGDATVPALITLDQAISIAIARTPTLQEGAFNVDFGEAAVDVARVATRPNVAVTGSSKRSYAQQTVAVSTPGVSTSNALSASISQLIFDGGQTRARIAAAVATQGSTQATYRRTAQQVAFDVATAYYNVLVAERTVAADRVVVQEDIVSENLVRAQIVAGIAARAALSSPQYATAQSRTALVRGQGTEQSARVNFAITLGLDADTAVLPVDDGDALMQRGARIAIPSYSAALATAFANRPDLQSAGLSVQAAGDSLRAAQRGRAPSISADVAKGLSSFDVSGGTFRNSASIGLTFSIPIYDQGLFGANVAEARATLGLVSAAQRATALTMQQDVRNSLIGVVSAESTLDQARAEYASAYRSLRQTQGQYRAGVTTLPALIQAQTSLAQALTDIVNAIYSLRQAHATLRFAVGAEV